MASTPEVIYRYKDDRSGKTADSLQKRAPTGWLKLTVSSPDDTDEMGNEKRQEYLLDPDSALSFRDWLANK